MTTLSDDALQTLFEPGQRLEPYLARVLDERALPANLREAAKYSLLGPGKRLRPILTIRSAEAVGAAAEAAYAPAAAIEMIHCFSLIHDDLPAMDDDDLRRGRPTLHKHTNEAMAILAGDLLSSFAFEHLAAASPSAIAGKLIHELATATNDMIAGQVYDSLPAFDESMEGLDRLKTIHRNKTGALIRCACRMGVIAGCHATDAGDDDLEKKLEAVTRYADAIGLMFQVVDDLLDVTQSTEHLGKAAGKDAEQGKLTYPGLLGIEKSREEVQRLRQVAHTALDDLSDGQSGDGADRTEALLQLCDFMAVRTR